MEHFKTYLTKGGNIVVVQKIDDYTYQGVALNPKYELLKVLPSYEAEYLASNCTSIAFQEIGVSLHIHQAANSAINALWRIVKTLRNVGEFQTETHYLCATITEGSALRLAWFAQGRLVYKTTTTQENGLGEQIECLSVFDATYREIYSSFPMNKDYFDHKKAEAAIQNFDFELVECDLCNLLNPTDEKFYFPYNQNREMFYDGCGVRIMEEETVDSIGSFISMQEAKDKFGEDIIELIKGLYPDKKIFRSRRGRRKVT